MRLVSALSMIVAAGALVIGACAPTPVVMQQATPMQDGPTGESTMMQDTPTSEAMAMPVPADTPNAMPEPSENVPEWLNTPLIDATTGSAFQLAGYRGKVVLVEPMAVWCTKCRAQQEQMQVLQSQILQQAPDLVLVSLDIDPNEDVELLKRYVNATGFDWMFAVAPPDLIRTIGQTYGDQFLNPPSTPMLIIGRNGVAHPLPFGIKSAVNLMQAVQPFLDASG